MKKLISTIGVLASVFAYSQVTFGLRANALFNTSSASWSNFKGAVSSAVDQKGDNATGFNVGLAAKIDLPITGWFLMPEVYYTNFKNTVEATDGTAQKIELEAKSSRIDVPVLFGHNLLSGKLAAFVGPVASFNTSSDNKYGSFEEKLKNDFTVGYQIGAQATLSKFVVNARYEGAFSKDSRSFISTVAGNETEIRYDNRPSMFILGIGYNFN